MTGEKWLIRNTLKTSRPLTIGFYEFYFDIYQINVKEIIEEKVYDQNKVFQVPPNTGHKYYILVGHDERDVKLIPIWNMQKPLRGQFSTKNTKSLEKLDQK